MALMVNASSLIETADVPEVDLPAIFHATSSEGFSIG